MSPSGFQIRLLLMASPAEWLQIVHVESSTAIGQRSHVVNFPGPNK